jgi:hypothetical protein
MTGPRQAKVVPKRRPLPSDPTGASPSPAVTPDYIQTPPRGYQTMPTHTPDYTHTPSRMHQLPPIHTPEHTQTPPRGYEVTTQHTPEQARPLSRGYHTPQTHIYTQSPLQAVEYNTPSQVLPQLPHEYDHTRGSTNPYNNHGATTPITPIGRQAQDDRYETHDQSGAYGDFNNGGHRGRYDDYNEDHVRNSHVRNDLRGLPSQLPRPVEYDAPPSPGGPPPPPPVHRSNHASPIASIPQSNGMYDQPQPNNAVRNIRGQQDTHRHSMPAYPDSRGYQFYSTQRNDDAEAFYADNNGYQEDAHRHHSYDDRYNGAYRSMQPTVEDVPSSPAVPYGHAYSNSEPHASHFDERRYDHVPPTAPLNLSGRGSAASGHYTTSSTGGQLYNDYNASPTSYRGHSHMGSEVSLQSSHSQLSQQGQSQRYHEEDQITASPTGYIPSLPPTLVAGMDPVIAQEVSERIYTENRASYSQNAVNSSRSRYSELPQPQSRQSYPHPHRQQAASVPFVPAAASSAAPVSTAYDQRQNRTYAPIVKPTAISPEPRRIPRKSVSPAPDPQSPEGRRLSGVPFGPDAYDALNPHVSTAAPTTQLHTVVKSVSPARPGQLPDPEASTKIIMHDGREVDPSDHLPETSWAPEPETRAPKQPETSRGRTMPNAGPRPLRQAGRPQSMSVGNAASSPMHPNSGLPDGSSPVTTPGRNRLQKKSNRNSAAAPQSSPLAPVSPYQDNSFATRSLPRAHTMDFAGENGYSSYGSPSHGRHGDFARRSVGGGPPVPAKVPMKYGPPQLPPQENAWALLEEMKSIDLGGAGGGRSRRKGWGTVA